MISIKQIFTIFLIAVTFSSFAQKVKVKKGIVKVDNVEVAKFGKNDKDAAFSYNLATLEGESVLDLNLKLQVINENKTFRWLEIKQPKSDLINEIDFEFLSFTLNTEKGIAEFLLKNLNFITNQGLDKDKINAFFSEKRTRESLQEAEALKEKEGLAIAQFNTVQPEVKPSFLIVSNAKINKETNEPEKIGKVMVTTVEDNRTYTFSNLFGQKVAVVQTKFKRIEALGTFFVLNYGDLDSDKVVEANNILKRIFMIEKLSHAFPHKDLANEVLASRKEKQQAEYKEAKENSSNIYNEKGFVVDDKGVKWEGLISVAFEAVKNPSEWKGMADASSYGNSLILRYENEKGKKKWKSFSAKKDTRFCLINEEGAQKCYQDMKIQGNGLLGQAPTVTFEGVGNVQYMEEIIKEGDLTVFQSYPSNRYVIKSINQDKAFNFAFGGLIKDEKKIEKLKDYLNGCELIGTLAYDEASFESLEKIKELIDFYNTSCK